MDKYIKYFNNIKNKIKKLIETNQTKELFEQNDIEKNKALAIIAYIIPFFPYFFIKNSKWVKYHSTQGMNLMIIYFIYSVISKFLINTIKVNQNNITCPITPWWILFPVQLANIVFILLSLIGIINVIKKKARPLPIIEKINIIK